MNKDYDNNRRNRSKTPTRAPTSKFQVKKQDENINIFNKLKYLYYSIKDFTFMYTIKDSMLDGTPNINYTLFTKPIYQDNGSDVLYPLDYKDLHQDYHEIQKNRGSLNQIMLTFAYENKVSEVVRNVQYTFADDTFIYNIANDKEANLTVSNYNPKSTDAKQTTYLLGVFVVIYDQGGYWICDDMQRVDKCYCQQLSKEKCPYCTQTDMQMKFQVFKTTSKNMHLYRKGKKSGQAILIRTQLMYIYTDCVQFGQFLKEVGSKSEPGNYLCEIYPAYEDIRTNLLCNSLRYSKNDVALCQNIRSDHNSDPCASIIDLTDNLLYLKDQKIDQEIMIDRIITNQLSLI